MPAIWRGNRGSRSRAGCHLIAGVDRRDIFHEPEDYGKFLVSLATQKEKLPFHLYAYCLMTNHLNRRICRQRSSLPTKPDRCPNTATPGAFSPPLSKCFITLNTPIEHP